jgi:hypothetical protein
MCSRGLCHNAGRKRFRSDRRAGAECCAFSRSKNRRRNQGWDPGASGSYVENGVVQKGQPSGPIDSRLTKGSMCEFAVT